MAISGTVLCSSRTHHSWPALAAWAEKRGFTIFDRIEDLPGGDLLLLVSCTEIVSRETRGKYAKTLVIHESDLPSGRGWSPLAWQILAGRTMFTASLLEAEDEVDSGAIWAKRRFVLIGHELSDEINATRDSVRAELMDYAVEHFHDAKPCSQAGKASYYVRRTPADSELDPYRSIASQFELLRICEPRFPAFFWFRDHRYEVTVKKASVAT